MLKEFTGDSKEKVSSLFNVQNSEIIEDFTKNSIIYFDDTEVNPKSFVLKEGSSYYSFLSEGIGRKLYFGNIESLFKKGYLQKFYDYYSSDKTFFTLPETSCVEYSEEDNEETVIAILDHETLSPMTKVVGMISYLTLFSGLSKETVISILENKEDVEKTKNLDLKSFKGMRVFLLEFSENISLSRNSPIYNTRSTNYASSEEGFKLLHSIMNFVNSESNNQDEVFKEYLDSNESKDIVYKNLSDTTDYIYNMVNTAYSNIFNTCTRQQMRYLISTSRYASNKDTLINLIQTYNDLFYEENELESFNIFASYYPLDVIKELTISEEAKKFFLNEKEDTSIFIKNPEIGAESLIKIVVIYINLGEERLKEISLYIKSLLNNNDESSGYMLTRKFLKKVTPILLLPENSDIPISWIEAMA